MIELGVPEENILLIPLPIRPLRSVAANEIEEKMSGHPKIVTCGFFLRHKGMKELILATEKIKEIYPTVSTWLLSPIYPHPDQSSSLEFVPESEAYGSC